MGTLIQTLKGLLALPLLFMFWTVGIGVAIASMVVAGIVLLVTLLGVLFYPIGKQVYPWIRKLAHVIWYASPPKDKKTP